MRAFAITALLLAASPYAFLCAATVSYTGTFSRDNDVKLITTTLTAPSSVTFRTYSYAGGVNATGATIASGGFDPLIDLFNSAGLLINENDDGGPLVPVDPVTFQNFDVLLQTVLPAGTYTVALAQYDNFANGPGLADGFFETDPNFTRAFGCPAGLFCDITGANRTANWALDITVVPSAPIPEPGSLSLLTAAGCAAIFVGLGRQKARGARQCEHFSKAYTVRS